MIFFLKYWRVFALAGGLLVLGWWHQHAVTKAYRQGATDGEASTLQKAAMKVEIDTAARRHELDERQSSLDAQEARTQGERAALGDARARVTSALQTSLTELATKGVDVRNEIQTLPDDAVNGRFRLSLERARSADRERAAQP